MSKIFSKIRDASTRPLLAVPYFDFYLKIKNVYCFSQLFLQRDAKHRSCQGSVVGEGPLPRFQKPSRQFPSDIFRYDHLPLGKKSLVPNPVRDRIRYGTKSVLYKIRYDQIRYGTKSVMGQNPLWDKSWYGTKSGIGQNPVLNKIR